MKLDELFTQEELEILQMRAARVAAPLQEEDRTGHITALIVVIHHETYALPIESIKAVYQSINIVPVPCVPNIVAGIANVRGHLISVLDLAAVLGLESGNASECGLVIADAGDSSIGFRVPTIGEVVDLPMSQMNPIPANMNVGQAEYLQGIFPDGTALLNLQAVLEDPRLVVDDSNN